MGRGGDGEMGGEWELRWGDGCFMRVLNLSWSRFFKNKFPLCFLLYKINHPYIPVFSKGELGPCTYGSKRDLGFCELNGIYMGMANADILSEAY
jgi:hypothetical protein